jgi:hypothetical protein
MKLLPFLILSFFLSSCVATTQYVEFAGEKEAAPGTAQVYVIRKSPLGTAVKANVFHDGTLIGKTGPRGYLSWAIPADGQPTEIMSKTENRERITIPFLAGETYYIRQRLTFGFLVSRFNLQLVSKEEGEKLVAKLKKPLVQVVEADQSSSNL